MLTPVFALLALFAIGAGFAVGLWVLGFVLNVWYEDESE